MNSSSNATTIPIAQNRTPSLKSLQEELMSDTSKANNPSRPSVKKDGVTVDEEARNFACSMLDLSMVHRSEYLNGPGRPVPRLPKFKGMISFEEGSLT